VPSVAPCSTAALPANRGRSRPPSDGRTVLLINHEKVGGAVARIKKWCFGGVRDVPFPAAGGGTVLIGSRVLCIKKDRICAGHPDRMFSGSIATPCPDAFGRVQASFRYRFKPLPALPQATYPSVDGLSRPSRINPPAAESRGGQKSVGLFFGRASAAASAI